MYSRYSHSSEKPIRIPEHYSGCAFSERHTEESAPRALGVARPTPPIPAPPVSEPAPLAEPSPPIPAEPIQSDAAEVALLTEAPPKHPSISSLWQGLEFDQLLILGLILLLSHSGHDTDIVWWLGLLLLCG